MASIGVKTGHSVPIGGKNKFWGILINLYNDVILKVLETCDHLQKKSTEKDQPKKSYGFSKLATSEINANYFGGWLKIFIFPGNLALFPDHIKYDHSGPWGLGVLFCYMVRHTKQL